ncbi:hypothetical protein [Pedobacter sp. N23S346]|uniref:hypothetical protein n=1 Tax=Pedobacter sp. N23S346 TaxID=3402750 RepID=UPI003AC06A69
MVDNKTIFKKLTIWGIVCLLLIYIFYFAIPIGTYQSATTLLAITGAISITVCIFVFFSGIFFLFDKYDENGKVKERPFQGIFLMIILLVSLFGNAILILWVEVNRESQELEKNGVIVMAKIVDGSSLAGRSIDLSNISVEFTDTTGVKHRLKVELSKTEFEKFYLNQEVPIVYSTKYMNINSVLYNEAEFLKYPKQQQQ